MAEAVRHDRTARQLRLLSDALDSGRLGPVRRLVNTLAPAEIGNLLESLPPGKREVVWGLVDPEDDGEVLLHVGDEVRESLLADMDPDEIVAAVEDLDIDDLANLVEDLPDTVIDEVLKSMDRENRERLEQVLSYPEDTAGRLMNPDVVTVRADVNVDVVLRYLRLRGELPDHTDHLYVVSRRHQYLGRVPLAALVTHEDSTPVNRLIDDEQPAIDVGDGSDEVARRFSDHDWISAPVVDDNNILLGRITIDDVVDIIREQAEHQAMSAAGLDEDEDMFSPARRAFRRRLIWLSINLCTAFLASSVVSRFEGSIEKLVALAALMPIVAGMGGNAGTQVLALMVRGLALGQIGSSNVMTLLKEGAHCRADQRAVPGHRAWRDRAGLVTAADAVAGDRHRIDGEHAHCRFRRGAGAGDVETLGLRSGIGRWRDPDHLDRRDGLPELSWPGHVDPAALTCSDCDCIEPMCRACDDDKQMNIRQESPRRDSPAHRHAVILQPCNRSGELRDSSLSCCHCSCATGGWLFQHGWAPPQRTPRPLRHPHAETGRAPVPLSSVRAGVQGAAAAPDRAVPAWIGRARR